MTRSRKTYWLTRTLQTGDGRSFTYRRGLLISSSLHDFLVVTTHIGGLCFWLDPHLRAVGTLARDPAWHVSTLLLLGSSDRPRPRTRPRNRSLTVAAKGGLQLKTAIDGTNRLRPAGPKEVEDEDEFEDADD
jgi:hypothetical protein